MRIFISKTINAPKNEVWSLLSDFSNIHNFHPLLKSSGFIEGSCTHEPGSVRRCDMLDGSYLKERIVEWKEGDFYIAEVYETSLPIKTSRATLGLSKLNNHTTLSYMYITMKSKYILLKPMLYLMFKFYAGPAILRGLSKATSQKMVGGTSELKLSTN